MSTVWHSEQGRVSVEVRGPRALLVTYVGAITGPSLQAVMPALTHALARTSSPTLFVDVQQMRTYSPDVRIETALFWKRHINRLSAIQVLVDPGARLITMGVAVMNLAIGGIARTTKDRAVFTRELTAAAEIESRREPGRAVA
jgi:hypothetical protein